MWRDVLAVVVGVNALAGLCGFLIKRTRREPTHAEYQERLRRENLEIDRMREEMSRGIRK